eukprot:COSAG05_NODE_38_length_27626_cov_78.614306_19_plen_226_part_00
MSKSVEFDRCRHLLIDRLIRPVWLPFLSRAIHNEPLGQYGEGEGAWALRRGLETRLLWELKRGSGLPNYQVGGAGNRTEGVGSEGAGARASGGRFRSSVSGQLHGTGDLAALAGFFDMDGGGGHMPPRSGVRVASPEHAAWTGARLLVLADDSDSGMRRAATSHNSSARVSSRSHSWIYKENLGTESTASSGGGRAAARGASAAAGLASTMAIRRHLHSAGCAAA